MELSLIIWIVLALKRINLLFLTFFSASREFCYLLITLANSLDPDQARQNVGHDLDGSHLIWSAVVECFTPDRGVAGSSITVLCPWARHINPSLVLVHTRKICPNITETLLTGTLWIKSNKSKPFDTLMVFLNKFWKNNWEKKSADDKKKAHKITQHAKS